MRSLLTKIFLIPITLGIFLSQEVIADDNDLINEGVRQLQLLIKQNQYNDAHGLSHLNKYVILLGDEAHTFEYGENKFVSPAIVSQVEANLRSLASEGIDFYVAFNGTRYLAEKLNTKDEYNSAKAILFEDTKRILEEIYNRSGAKNANNGKNALLGITPINTFQIGNVGSEDRLKLTYLRVIAPGVSFPMIYDIMRLKYGSNQTALKTYAQSPDEAIIDHIEKYKNIMLNYDREISDLNPENLKGFALDYYKFKNSEKLTSTERDDLLKLCRLFEAMGVNLSASYLREISDEKIGQIARSLVRGEYTKPGLMTNKELYESLLPRYKGYLKVFEDILIEKNGEKAIALVRKLNKAELEDLPVEARVSALAHLHEIDLTGSFIFRGDEEVITELISSTPADQATEFLNSLAIEKVQYKGKSSSLVYALMDNYDDWSPMGGSNYLSLVNALKEVILKSPRYLENSLRAIAADGDAHSIFWKRGPLISSCDGLSVGDHKYDFHQDASGKILVKKKILKSKSTQYFENPIPPEGVCDWDMGYPEHSIDPFALVVFVDVTERNPLLEAANPADYFVPALFLRYMQDETVKSERIAKMAIIVDVVLATTGSGLVVSALRQSRWLLALWEAGQVAASVGNLLANASSDPQLREAVESYNLFMIGIGAANLARSYTRFGISDVKRAVGVSGSEVRQVDEALLSRMRLAWEEVATNINRYDDVTQAQLKKIIEYQQSKGWLREGSVIAKGGAKLLDDVALKNLTPEIPSGTFVNSTKFNSSALKIDPPANSQLKQLADDVKLNGDVDIPGGSKTEQIQDILYNDAGYTKLDGKVGSNQGLDGLYIKGDVKNPTEIIVGEAKQWSSSGGASLSPANANTGLPVQMSDAWIQNVAQRLKDSGKSDVADMLINNQAKIQKYLTVVDKTSGQIKLLKLGSY